PTCCARSASDSARAISMPGRPTPTPPRRRSRERSSVTYRKSCGFKARAPGGAARLVDECRWRARRLRRARPGRSARSECRAPLPAHDFSYETLAQRGEEGKRLPEVLGEEGERTGDQGP